MGFTLHGPKSIIFHWNSPSLHKKLIFLDPARSFIVTAFKQQNTQKNQSCPIFSLPWLQHKPTETLMAQSYHISSTFQFLSFVPLTYAVQNLLYFYLMFHKIATVYVGFVIRKTSAFQFNTSLRESSSLSVILLLRCSISGKTGLFATNSVSVGLSGKLNNYTAHRRSPASKKGLFERIQFNIFSFQYTLFVSS